MIKDKKKKNLLSDDKKDEKEDKTETIRYGSYIAKDLYLSLVDFQQVFAAGSIPEPIQKYMQFDSKNQSYYPVFYINDFWNIPDYMTLLNDTVTEIPIRMEFYVMSFIKWQLYVQMGQSFEMQKSFGSVGEGEEDELKRMFLETNPILLGTTIIVSILHTLFDFLAFKNDIQFWKEKKSMEGISIRTLFINFGFQIVIFLYLVDNETSWLILISSFVGLLIEAWKISKAVNFSVSLIIFISIENYNIPILYI